jgi:hypothetical protein
VGTAVYAGNSPWPVSISICGLVSIAQSGVTTAVGQRAGALEHRPAACDRLRRVAVRTDYAADSVSRAHDRARHGRPGTGRLRS